MLNIRNILSILLIAILLFESGVQSYYYNWYIFNNDSFTAMFCENKEDVQRMCNGTCYMNEINQNQDQRIVLNIDNLHLDYIIEMYNLDLELDYESILVKSITANCTFSDDFIFVKDVFHPPKNIFDYFA